MFLSAFLPTLGFLLGGGSTDSVLFTLYAFHACLVAAHDVFGGNGVLFYACLSATDLLFAERSHAATASAWSWVSGLTSALLEPERSQSWVVLRAASLTLAGNPPPTELAAWILCLIMSIMTHYYNKTARRMVLGWVSYSEARRALLMPDAAAHHFIRFVCIFSFIVLFLVRHATNNPKRLQSALTVFTTTVLTWCGLRGAWHQWQQPHAPAQDPNGERVAAFYVAYCFVDMLFAHAYYPEYFTLLEGWFHHMATGALAIYLVRQGKAAIFCPAMMVETSTILLSLRRTFYDSPLVRRFYDEWFRTLFVAFRIVMPVLFLWRIWRVVADDPVILPAFGVFTGLNLYWLTRQKKIRTQEKNECTRR